MPTDTITIQSDRGPLCVPQGCTLADALPALLAGSALDPHSVATAVNGDFVARTERAQHVLHEGDAVLCFAPITGG